MCPVNGRRCGFTLLEVLISVIVFAAGLMGLAGLQTIGQQFDSDAYLRSQAVVYAYDMADRMRANMAGVRGGSYDRLNTAAYPTDPGCTGAAAACTPSQIARYDAWQWRGGIVSGLPRGKGTVSGDGERFVIAVVWDRDGDGSVDEDEVGFSVELRL